MVSAASSAARVLARQGRHASSRRANIPKRYLLAPSIISPPTTNRSSAPLEAARRIPDRFDHAASRELVGRGVFLDGQPGSQNAPRRRRAQGDRRAFGVSGLFYDTA